MASNTSATSSANTWYKLRILAKGSDVTVWRGTVDGPMEQVLATTSAPTPTVQMIGFSSGANSTFDYDDIGVIADGWTSTTTFATNAGNELAMMSQDGAPQVTFTYDAWGRMTGRSDGTASATYAYEYGDKLTSVSSTFPGEGSVSWGYGARWKHEEPDSPRHRVTALEKQRASREQGERHRCTKRHFRRRLGTD